MTEYRYAVMDKFLAYATDPLNLPPTLCLLSPGLIMMVAKKRYPPRYIRYHNGEELRLSLSKSTFQSLQERAVIRNLERFKELATLHGYKMNSKAEQNYFHDIYITGVKDMSEFKRVCRMSDVYTEVRTENMLFPNKEIRISWHELK